jgi:hypothetical protein
MKRKVLYLLAVVSICFVSIQGYILIKPPVVYVVNQYDLGTQSTKYLTYKTEIDNQFGTYYTEQPVLIDSYHPHGLNKLIKAVEFIKSLPMWDYDSETYNCYGMAACTEWILEELGFNTTMACGVINNSNHSWVIVMLDNGCPVSVETTGRYIIETTNPDVDSYYNAGRLSSDIYELAVTSQDSNINHYDWYNHYGLSMVNILGLANKYIEE